jgi:hypothetical protein
MTPPVDINARLEAGCRRSHSRNVGATGWMTALS